MRATRTSLAVVGLLLALLGTVAPGCSRAQYVVVTVSLAAGSPNISIASLQVTFLLSGSASGPVSIGGPIVLPANFSGSIPANAVGSIEVGINALDAAGVQLASGLTGAPVPLDPSGITSVTVILTTVVAECGNDVVEAGEECDDGNTAFGDGCDGSCLIEGGCGNGVVDAGEECDDGNKLSGDGCDAFCVSEGVCGDGTIDPPDEACDDGNTVSGDGCDSTCRLEGGSVCGNGVIEPPTEVCDDGNLVPGDGCDPSCQVEPGGCGDGAVDAGEECDDANFFDTDDCTNGCLLPFCGDGIVWSDGSGVEECDDPDPTDNSDGCYADCSAPGPTPAAGEMDAEFASATIHGGSSFDNLGTRLWRTSPMASGDFNGDGIADLLVGAPYADGPSDVRFECGEAYVVLGGDFAPGGAEFDVAGTDFPGVNLTIYGKGSNEQFGAAVAAADVNGDGIDDIVVGAPFRDAPGPPVRTDAGEVYVILGSSTLGGTIDLATTAPYLTVIGSDQFDNLGSVIVAAPVDGDASADLILGLPYADGPANARSEGGDVAVVLSTSGTRDLLTTPASSLLYGAEASDNFGTSVGAGDFDGDGLTDIVVAAQYAWGPMNTRPQSGEIYVFRGTAALPATQDVLANANELTFFPSAFDTMGSVAVADLNGDLLDDVVAGGSGNNGRVIAFLGRSLTLAITLDSLALQMELDFVGNFNPMFGSSALGYEVTTADLNADGALDVVSGASNWVTPLGGTGAIFGIVSPSLAIGAVASYTLDPVTGGAPPDVTIIRPAEGTMIGAVGVGDFNHDGHPDLAMQGAFLDSGATASRVDGGKIIVYFPGPGPLIPAADCINGSDDDGDGAIDLNDPGCEGVSDASEYLGSQCDDGADNDADAIIDYPFEPGCSLLADDDELDPFPTPACANGVDDDGDGLADYPGDPGCTAAGDSDENHCLYDFGGGAAMGWTFSNSCIAAPVGWQLDSFRSVSPTFSLYYGNPAARNFDCPISMTNSGSATSAVLTIPASGATVRFWFWGSSESCSPSGGYDRVTLSVVMAGVPTTVWSRCDFPETQNGTMGAFVEQVVDLTPFAGMTLQLQFFQDTIDGIGNSSEGFYLDDILVATACP